LAQAFCIKIEDNTSVIYLFTIPMVSSWAIIFGCLVQSLEVAALRIGAETNEFAFKQDYGHPAWLSECENIYLDFGTNIGVQIRKLFEPHKYPKALVTQVFDSVFGEVKHRPKTTCALGMEPNPDQHERLQSLETGYNQRGFRVHIYPFAAWKEEGTLDFQTWTADGHESWGSRISSASFVELPTWRVTKVRTVDLAAFIKTLPQGKTRLMKLDIEGAEYETLANAIPKDILCKDTIPKLYIESHRFGSIATWKGARNFKAVAQRIKNHNCKNSSPTELLALDDETYLHDVDDNFTGKP